MSEAIFHAKIYMVAQYLSGRQIFWMYLKRRPCYYDYGVISYYGVTTFTCQGHVTSLITWPVDSPHVISYWWSFGNYSAPKLVQTHKDRQTDTRGKWFLYSAPCTGRTLIISLLTTISMAYYSGGHNTTKDSHHKSRYRPSWRTAPIKYSSLVTSHSLVQAVIRSTIMQYLS